MNPREVENWLAAALPGERLHYFTGHLALTRWRHKKVDDLGNAIYRAYIDRLVIPFQTRSNNDFDYWIQRI